MICTYKNNGGWLVFISLLIVILSSCSKEEELVPDNSDSSVSVETNDENIEISKWIYEWMDEVYFWNNTFSSTINFSEKTDPKEFFYELVYDEEDKWSYITDDFTSLEAELSGTPVSMGYSPAFGLFSNSDKVFILVEYVYPESPADLAGLKRGDIIITIDGQSPDTTNYYDLYSGSAYTVGLGAYDGNSISGTGKTISLIATAVEADPLIYDTVFSISGTKIGYMVYTGFVSGTDDQYLETLGEVFDAFSAQGVTELVVDLRYNPGGNIDASAYMASAIAPPGIAGSGNVFTTFVYNDFIQYYYEVTEGEESENLVYKFPENAHNLGLNRVYFLTTHSTASACELLITGLDPYMEVVVIGESTYGKYTGSWVIYDFDEPRQHDWAMMPIVMKYANANGYTDFVDGLPPDILIEDDLFAAKQFGDTDDPMLAEALFDIAGQNARIKTPRHKSVEYQKLESSAEKFKRNLIIPKESSSN